ncbi:MAG: cupin domain-containing protein [Burkholderiaceae bacterium]|jgi:50S ribosomal protein L16 3-hydroxylase
MPHIHQPFEAILPFDTLSDHALAEFLVNDWHIRPRLFRQALHGDSLEFDPTEILSLATNPDAESRLISCFDGKWRLTLGPLDSLPSRRKKNWTVLVQGVEQQLAQADRLLQRFRFLPDARLDDLMISFATDGGGVGPHVDSYDVFLLQVHGQRRWRIGKQNDLSLRTDLPLKILANFQPSEEMILDPGDLLYLPPDYAHEGVAIGDCLTVSIGFRAPTASEILAAALRGWADAIEAEPDEWPTRFADPGRGATAKPACLPADLLVWADHLLQNAKWSAEILERSLGQYLTEPKDNVFFDAPERKWSRKKIVSHWLTNGVRLSARSKIVYGTTAGYLNGERFSFVCSQFHTVFQLLADQHGLTAEQCRAYGENPAVMPWLEEIFNAGWLT